MVLSQKVELESGLLRRIADDPEGAAVPGVLGATQRFLVKFTRRSWEMTLDDVDDARAAGAADSDIVDWCQMGAVQTLAVNQADGGGVAFPEQGSDAVGHNRSFYAKAPEGLTGAWGSATGPYRRDTAVDTTFVATDENAPAYRAEAERAKSHWGFVPRLLTAVSGGRSPSLLPFHTLALQLLEGPQSNRLTPRQHALVRAVAAGASRGRYAETTISRQLERAGESPDGVSLARGDIAGYARDRADELIFAFAEKAAWNAYKITAKDRAGMREAGLGDETYLDVLGTVGLQLGIDRIANALGVAPEPAPIL
jgi:hypothetical protein